MLPQLTDRIIFTVFLKQPKVCEMLFMIFTCNWCVNIPVLELEFYCFLPKGSLAISLDRKNLEFTDFPLFCFTGKSHSGLD